MALQSQIRSRKWLYVPANCGTRELAAAKKRIRQLETDLAVSRKVNEIFLDQDIAPKASTR